MGVVSTAEGLELLLGAGEGGLGVDDPVVLPEGGETRGEGAGLREGVGERELAGGRGAVEGLELPGAEDHRKRADGEEEARFGGEPARAVGGQRAPRDNAVQGELAVLDEMEQAGLHLHR